MRVFVVVLFSLAVAIGHLTIPTRHNVPTWAMSYEALAHLYVGFLIAAGVFTGSWLYWWSLIGLTVWELICFFYL